jgi:hypothetical protein
MQQSMVKIDCFVVQTLLNIKQNIKQKLYKTIAAVWFNKTNKPTTAENTSTSTLIRKPEAATAV